MQGAVWTRTEVLQHHKVSCILDHMQQCLNGRVQGIEGHYSRKNLTAGWHLRLQRWRADLRVDCYTEYFPFISENCTPYKDLQDVLVLLCSRMSPVIIIL